MLRRSIISSCSSSILACRIDFDTLPCEASISRNFPCNALLTTHAAKTLNRTNGKPAFTSKLFVGSSLFELLLLVDEDADEDAESDLMERCNRLLFSVTVDWMKSALLVIVEKERATTALLAVLLQWGKILRLLFFEGSTTEHLPASKNRPNCLTDLMVKHQNFARCAVSKIMALGFRFLHGQPRLVSRFSLFSVGLFLWRRAPCLANYSTVDYHSTLFITVLKEQYRSCSKVTSPARHGPFTIGLLVEN